MPFMRGWSILCLLLFFFVRGSAQDSVRVLCVYGSVPAKGWKGVEPVFHKGLFTRVLHLRGGHVGVETGDDTSLSFHPLRYNGPFHSGHIFNRDRRPNSVFRVISVQRMW